MDTDKQKMRTKFVNSISFKLIVMGILILILLIPVSSVKELINERQERRKGAITEINSKWGPAQTITGPILSIPYKKSIKSYNTEKKIDETKVILKYLHILCLGTLLQHKKILHLQVIQMHQMQLNQIQCLNHTMNLY